MRILHLAADYPDPVRPRKTRAVSNLIELIPEHTHRVISMNRVTGLGTPGTTPFEDAAGAHVALTYRAPPLGVLHRTFLEGLAGPITGLADGPVDLVHAHKLTVEGIVARKVAEALGVPFLVSVQGNTDLKIAGARPDLAPLFRRIWRGAAEVLPFAPWAAEALTKRLGARTGPVTPLPCPGPADALIAPRVTPVDEAPLIVSAFNLADAKNKNAARLIRAAATAAREVPGLRLKIIGQGEPGPLRALAAEALPGQEVFAGPVPNAEMQAAFNAATAFAMVSHRETFGMVFSEALLAGAPCLYPAGRAIAGYFEDGSVVLSADPKDEAGIAAALVRLVHEESTFKARLAAMQETGGLAFLRREGVAGTYRAALDRAAG